MRFTRTALYNFRNFKHGPVRFTWGAGLNLIVGPNGAGKTNLIEALNILSGWSPFARRIGGVISWDKANPEASCQVSQKSNERKGSFTGDELGRRAGLIATVTGDGANENEANHEIEARISSLTVLKVDGKRETSTNLRLMMPSVTFLPTDTGLIDGPPSVRRAFVDRLCALCIPVYARKLADFRKISMRRSAMLARAAHGEPISGANVRACDQVFAQLGGWIMEARRATVARLATLLDTGNGNSLEVGLSAVPYSFALTPAWDRASSNGTGASMDGESFLRAEMSRMADRERAAGRVLVGPGRMELEFKVALSRINASSGTGSDSWHPASEALSRGQKRRLVLSFVLLAAHLTEVIIKRSPVLLLDDLAAELDADGRKAAGEALRATGWQVILTGVDDPFPDDSVKMIHRLG